MLQLYVFDPKDDYYDDIAPPSVMRTGEYLRRAPSWVPDLNETLLLLDPSVGFRMPFSSFGSLIATALQLSEVADRLELGKLALIRNSIESTPTYLVLEPRDAATYLSTLAELPREVEYWPLPGPNITSGDHREELYTFVEAHRNELRPGGRLAGSMSRDDKRLQKVPLANSGLIPALRAEAADGLRLVKTLFPNARLP